MRCSCEAAQCLKQDWKPPSPAAWPHCLVFLVFSSHWDYYGKGEIGGPGMLNILDIAVTCFTWANATCKELSHFSLNYFWWKFYHNCHHLQHRLCENTAAVVSHRAVMGPTLTMVIMVIMVIMGIVVIMGIIVIMVIMVIVVIMVIISVKAQQRWWVTAVMGPSLSGATKIWVTDWASTPPLPILAYICTA